jgi:2-oxoisovalerate dehydrogenase E1 component alpha subunit
MLMSATIPTPTLFLVRNNGFAISTPAAEQYGSADGIVARGPGYGLPSARVDGNDVLAVLGATRAARKLCLETGRGVLLEAMTYRVGHHSTSDDSFAYRPRQEVEERKRLDDPIGRFRAFLYAQKWWDEAADEELKARLKKDVIKAYRDAETLQRHPLKEMFTDVYAEEPWNIVRLCSRRTRAIRWRSLQREQREELSGLLKKYGQDWEPWRNELKTFEGEGKEMMGERK